MTILNKQPLSLFHFDTDLLDTSSKVWSPNGSLTVSNTQSKFGGSSLNIPQGSYLSTPVTNDFKFGVKDFTVSCWVYMRSYGGGFPKLFGLQPLNGVNNSIHLALNSGSPYISFTNTDYIQATSNIPLNSWHHIEVSRKNGIFYMFIDGIKVIENNTHLTTNFDITNTYGTLIGYDGFQSVTFFDGYIDELLITQECLHTTNFTPPTSAYEVALSFWLAKTKNIPSYWSYKTNSWVDVGLPTTDADIATLFVNQGTNTCPTQQQLELLGTGINRPNRCCYQPAVATQPTININAIPTGKIVKPVDLLPIASIEGIDSVSIANTITTGTAKLAVTLDLVTYYKFNGIAWEVIDINTNQDNMMDIATVTSINRSQWDLLTNGTASGIAFAYYLDISGTGDTVKIDKTSLVVDMKGEWNSAIKDTDFRYGYPANDRLKVTLLTTGNYKINYVGG